MQQGSPVTDSRCVPVVKPMAAVRPGLSAMVRAFKCETDVSRGMSTDGTRMTKLDVRVPRALVERIDEEYERRGYTSRSEAIRDALRAWIDPPVRLSDEVLEELATSRRQVERGETTPLEEIARTYGVDLDE